jgi:hypothetical protein
MEESDNQLPQWESPLKKLWDIFMFRVFVLPGFLKTVNLIALIYCILMSLAYCSAKLFLAIPILWIYVIALRIVSELALLCYNFLVQRTQGKE